MRRRGRRRALESSFTVFGEGEGRKGRREGRREGGRE